MGRQILNFVPVTRTFDMSLSRECICPLIVTRGSDQMPLNARFQSRSDRSIIGNYGLYALAHTLRSVLASAAIPNPLVLLARYEEPRATICDKREPWYWRTAIFNTGLARPGRRARQFIRHSTSSGIDSLEVDGGYLLD